MLDMIIAVTIVSIFVAKYNACAVLWTGNTELDFHHDKKPRIAPPTLFTSNKNVS